MKRMETQVRNPQLKIDRKSDFLDCEYCRFPTIIPRLLPSDIIIGVFDDEGIPAVAVPVAVDDNDRRHSSECIISSKHEISPLPSASATRTRDVTTTSFFEQRGVL